MREVGTGEQVSGSGDPTDGNGLGSHDVHQVNWRNVRTTEAETNKHPVTFSILMDQ